MTYRLLALTVDGALLRSNTRISRQTKEAIDYVKKKGVYVTLVTDRPFLSAQKIAKNLKVEDDLITHDGAYIASSMDEEPTYERRLNEDKVFHIVEILERYHCHVRLLHERYSIGNKVRQKNHLMAKMTIGIGDPLFYPLSFVESLSEYLLKTPVAVPQISAYFMNEDERVRAMEELEHEVPAIRMRSAEDGKLSIVSEGVSKARSLQVLGRRLGISLNEMVAIGANENDIDMINQAGLGVSMGNSPEKVRKIANWVTRSNDQNGVSYMVKEVFRKQLRVRL